MTISEKKEIVYSLLDAIPIEVNYKDDIFLAEASNALQNKAAKDKHLVTFTEVLLDLINNRKEAKIKELEKEYITSKTRNALCADESFDDKFVDEIIEKMYAFLKQIKGQMNKQGKKHLREYFSPEGKLQLVYTDKKKSVYRFNTLPDLIETIAKCIICYCNDLDDFSKFNPNTVVKKDHDKTAPLFIRKICALICYALLELGDHAAIKVYRKSVDDFTGIPSQIMKALHKKCANLGYPYFKKEDGFFQYDKWSISPENMLRVRSYIPPMSPVTYPGAKQGYLGYMIAELQAQIVYRTYIDAFGGSGIAIAQFRHNKDAEYYINDFSFVNTCYYKLLKAPDADFEEFMLKLNFLKERVYKAHDLKNRDVITKSDLEDFMDSLYGFYKDATAVCCDSIKADALLNSDLKTYHPACIVTSKDESKKTHRCPSLKDGFKQVFGVGYRLPKEIDAYCNGKISYIDIAVLFIVFFSLTICGGAEPPRKPKNDDVGRLGRKDFSLAFNGVREAYKDVNILSDIGDSAMSILRTAQYNNPETLVYLDSPYIGTAKYSVNTVGNNSTGKRGDILPYADLGKEYIQTDFDMKDLLDACFQYSGKFIFSCRLNMVRSNIVDLFHPIKNPSKTVCINYNNYLWFMNQWLVRDGFNVLFMINKDRFNVEKDGQTVIDYGIVKFQDMADVEKWLEVEDEAIRKEFLDSKWGMDLPDEDRLFIYKYLRDIVLNGRDFEIMITNFDFETPKFDNMYEHISNEYNKQSLSIKGIPYNGLFVKMPMNVLAKFVVAEMSKHKKKAGDIKF